MGRYGSVGDGGYAAWGEKEIEDYYRDLDEYLKTLPSRIGKLKKDLSATISESDVYHPGSSSGGDAREAVWNEEYPNTEKREAAKKKLLQIYNLYGPRYREGRYRAGRALGYSLLRIFLHEFRR